MRNRCFPLALATFCTIFSAVAAAAPVRAATTSSSPEPHRRHLCRSYGRPQGSHVALIEETDWIVGRPRPPP